MVSRLLPANQARIARRGIPANLNLPVLYPNRAEVSITCLHLLQKGASIVYMNPKQGEST